MTNQEKQAASPDAVSAVRWSAASKYGAQAMQFGVSLLLARLLAPEYFGLLGMATVITGFANTLKNLGFNAAIVQRDDIDHKLLSTLFWVNLAFCGTIALVSIGVAPIVSDLYRDDRIGPLVSVLAIGIFLNAFSTVPSALLQKRLEFKKLAIRELGAVVTSGTIGISAALLGFGVWSLVFATLSMAISDVVLLNIAEPFIPSFTLDKKRLRECMRFGINITGFNVFNYFSRNADNLIIGIFLGPVPLGYYSLAYRLMLVPRDSITSVVSRVLFPKLSRLKDNDEHLTATFLKVCGGIAFVSFPMMVGLATISGRFVPIALGEIWRPAIPIIWILAPIGALQAVWGPIGQIFLAKGRSDAFLRFGLIGGCVFVSSFLIGVNWGVLGVAVSYAIACLFWMPLSYYFACQLVQGLSLAKIIREISPSITASCGMGLIVHLFGLACAVLDIPEVAVLTASVVAGIIAYVSISYAFKIKAMLDVLEVFPWDGKRLMRQPQA